MTICQNDRKNEYVNWFGAAILSRRFWWRTVFSISLRWLVWIDYVKSLPQFNPKKWSIFRYSFFSDTFFIKWTFEFALSLRSIYLLRNGVHSMEIKENSNFIHKRSYGNYTPINKIFLKRFFLNIWCTLQYSHPSCFRYYLQRSFEFWKCKSLQNF